MNADDLPRDFLEDLIANGYTAQDIAVAATLDELDGIVWERIIRGGRSEFHLQEIAAEVGVEAHQAREWLKAAGLRAEANATMCAPGTLRGLNLPRFRGHPNTAENAVGEVDVQKQAKST